jgi:hypothetical protein
MVAPRIGAVAERSSVDDRRVQKIVMWVMRVVVGVENVWNRELASAEDQWVLGLIGREPEQPAIDILLVSPKVDGLAEEDSLETDGRRGVPDLTGLAAVRCRRGDPDNETRGEVTR